MRDQMREGNRRVSVLCIAWFRRKAAGRAGMDHKGKEVSGEMINEICPRVRGKPVAVRSGAPPGGIEVVAAPA